VVISLVVKSAGAQEIVPATPTGRAAATPGSEAPVAPREPPPPRSPLVKGLDSLVGGFFDGFLEGMERAAHLSLIARDWDAAQLLLGHLAPIDEVLRERSKRMLLVRRRLASPNARLVPFLQAGLGQWRVDPDMPAIPHDVVLAGQLGAGIELHLSRLASVAAEAECTVLNPMRSDAQWIHTSALWGSFLAARVKF
jgi:hypothetical protein